jgi:5-methylthioadenosine/S-adenosylhomocysteine deaminase
VSTVVAIDGASILCGGSFRTGTVRTAGGTIAALAWHDDERRALRNGAAEVVDGTGCWLVPGLVSAHTHAYGTLLRGTESALPLELWSLYTIAYGYGLDDEAIAAAMLLHDAECIRSGITGVIDHFPHLAHVHAALAAHERSGMRVMLAAFVQDLSDYDLLALDVPSDLRALATVAPLDIPAYEAFFADLLATARAGSGRVQLALGPNAPQRCSDALWGLWGRIRERHGVAVHTHALETRAQARIARERWPGGMFAALDAAGLLDARLSLAHAVWTTAAERELLARRGVTVSHNPISNLTLGSGIMPLRDALDAGLTVGLGTDGSNSAGRHDLFETMRTALVLPRIAESDATRWPSAARVLEMGTADGMRILGLNAAGIAAGAPADLVLVRRNSSTNVMPVDTVDGFVSHAGREAVEAVMIDGTWVLRDGTIRTFDEACLLATVANVHATIAERRASIAPRIEAALAGLAAQLEPWQQPL